MEYKLNSTVCFGSAAEAQMVMNALDVDRELNEGSVSRELHVEDSTLHIHFAASEARLLRAAASAFYDLLGLATRTLEEFGPPK